MEWTLLKRDNIRLQSSSLVIFKQSCTILGGINTLCIYVQCLLISLLVPRWIQNGRRKYSQIQVGEKQGWVGRGGRSQLQHMPLLQGWKHSSSRKFPGVGGEWGRGFGCFKKVKSSGKTSVRWRETAALVEEEEGSPPAYAASPEQPCGCHVGVMWVSRCDVTTTGSLSHSLGTWWQDYSGSKNEWTWSSVIILPITYSLFCSFSFLSREVMRSC